MTQLPLRLLHSETILSRVKLDQFRRLSTADLIESLALDKPGALKRGQTALCLTATIESLCCASGELAWTPFRAK